jgi:AraC family transcriptional regulator
LYVRAGIEVLAKIAIDLKRRPVGPVDKPGKLEARIVAKGRGWTVEDVLCSRGPNDRRFEEQHDQFVIAIVTSGTFQYHRSGADREDTMTPGSLLLGRPGQCFECGHEHGAGDRCLAFHFAADYFGDLAAGTGRADDLGAFRSPKLSPVRTLSPVVADACAALSGASNVGWEELGIRLVARALQIDNEKLGGRTVPSPAAVSRISDVVRAIDANPAWGLTLVSLARDAGLSPFHFLRTFASVTGTTPHQYMLRTRLRKAAVRLAREDVKIVDVAFETGFGDVSNFNRAFRAEFGVNPTAYRQRRRP